MKFKAKDIFDEVSTWGISNKIEFCERLLSQMIVMNRAIWCDDSLSDKEKVECLKWSNELAHRIWNKIFELQNGADNDAIKNIWENILFYREQSQILGGHLGATIKLIVTYFEKLKNIPT